MEHFYEGIDGWFNFAEIYGQAVREAEDGAKFVEIGSWYGRSAAWMAVEIANSGKRIDFSCVDTWKGSVDLPWMAEQLRPLGGSCKHLFLQNMQRGGVDRLVKALEMPSVEAARLFDDESLDFVFVDGAHDYDNVCADVRAWYPKVKAGGVIAGDDVGWPGVIAGVQETIPETEYQLRNSSANWWHRKSRREHGTWISGRRDHHATDHLVYIPYVNNFPLLDRAVRSIERVWPSLIVIDQSEEGLQAPWAAAIAGVYRIPFLSISFTQMMNWARSEAMARGVALLAFMHGDAECAGEDVAPRVIAFARDRIPAHAAITFTHYDAFAVFTVEALRDVGPWDETFRWYYADIDYYRRVGLRGWGRAEFGGDLIRHARSQTLASDLRISARVAESDGWHARHYQHKWGGPPGREQFRKPYNGRP